ncbi:MAG: AcrR family transcriptional regulator, partial [Myxococcota bacterium]
EARALILESAKTLIVEHGPELRLKDVANRAGVSHALVTHYFGTIGALIETAFADHIRENRVRTMEKLAELGPGPGSIGVLIDQLFGNFAGMLQGRLLAWSLLSGRLDHEDFLPGQEEGLRIVADALEARADANKVRLELDRDRFETMLIMVVSSAIGYSVGREALWKSLGRKATEARDAQFLDFVTDAVHHLLHRAPVEEAAP